MKTLFTITALTAALLTGCGSDDADQSSQTSQADQADRAGRDVSIKTFMFSPDPIEVEAGTTVAWKNDDQTTHTVTSGSPTKPDGRFDAKLAAGASHSETFDKPGTYAYFCDLHSGPGMRATVVVR